MPNVLTFGSYIVFFWYDEQEPVHVHVSIKKPAPNGTKIWLTKSGGCIVAHNKSRIPESDLNKITELLENNFFLICSKWVQHFGEGSLKFYC